MFVLQVQHRAKQCRLTANEAGVAQSDLLLLNSILSLGHLGVGNRILQWELKVSGEAQ